MPALIQQYRQAGIDAKLVAAVGTILPTVFKVAGDAMDGVVSADIYFSDLEPFTKIPENVAVRAGVPEGARRDARQGRGARRPGADGVGGRGRRRPRASTARRWPKPFAARRIGGTLFGDVTFAAQRPDAVAPHPLQGRGRQDHEARGPQVRTSRCPAAPVLRVEGLGVRYGALVALHDMSWARRRRADPRHHRTERRGQEQLLRRRHQQRAATTATSTSTASA